MILTIKIVASVWLALLPIAAFMSGLNMSPDIKSIGTFILVTEVWIAVVVGFTALIVAIWQ